MNIHKTYFIAVVLLLSFSLFGCKKENVAQPYIIFKSLNGNIINDNVIYVSQDAKYRLIVENGYEQPTPNYVLQTNDESARVVSDSSFVIKKGSGWNGRKGVKLETVRVELDFNLETYESEDTLKFSCNHSNIKESLIFVIE